MTSHPIWIVCPRKQSYCLGSGNKTMSLPVMTDPDYLFIGDSKVNARNRTLISPLQLSQPLVRGIKLRVTGTA